MALVIVLVAAITDSTTLTLTLITLPPSPLLAVVFNHIPIKTNNKGGAQ